VFSKLDLHLSRSGHAFIFGCVHAPSRLRRAVVVIPSAVMLHRADPWCRSFRPGRARGRSHKVPTESRRCGNHTWCVVGAWWRPSVATVSTAKGRCLLPPGSPDRWPCFVLGRCLRYPLNGGLISQHRIALLEPISWLPKVRASSPSTVRGQARVGFSVMGTAIGASHVHFPPAVVTLSAVIAQTIVPSFASQLLQKFWSSSKNPYKSKGLI